MPRIADPLAKSKLLHAARAEFAAQGVASARVEDIAKRAGLAKGTFYLHFETKEEAFLDIVHAFFAEVARLADSCRGGGVDSIRTPADAVGYFRNQDLQLFEFLWNNRDVLRLILDSSSSYAHILDGFLESKEEMAVEDIRSFQSRALYRDDVDPRIVARIFTGAYYNLARRLTQAKTKPDLASQIDTVLKVFFEGLLARPHRRNS